VDQRRKSEKTESNKFKKLRLLRKLGNSGVLPEDPRVGSSILSLGTIKSRGCGLGRSPLFFLVADSCIGVSDVVDAHPAQFFHFDSF
jgi:hypothetical protein